MNFLKKTVKKLLLKTIWRYDANRLVRFLKKNGIQAGDTLVVHSSWLTENGFVGTPLDFINALKKVVSDEGLLVMMSMPYHNQSSAEFIRSGGVVKVKRSPSKMGLLTEVFRRGRDTLRSRSPTHPLLAWGKDAESFLADHINCEAPFGQGSPFEKMLLRGAKIVAVDAPFSTITYTHFLEDSISDALPFTLYEKERLVGKVIDEQGQEYDVPVKVLSTEANARRRDQKLLDFFESERIVKHKRLGATRFIFVECAPAFKAIKKMYAQRQSMFE